ncbi:hypothetical protein GE09DRAFT_1214569 [Coniochaeta sp. 2T2.1]|nr:hypothetical protein GE09DRAFT_1214569 [Coniochaeta sp. 2T2.1]
MASSASTPLQMEATTNTTKPPAPAPTSPSTSSPPPKPSSQTTSQSTKKKRRITKCKLPIIMRHPVSAARRAWGDYHLGRMLRKLEEEELDYEAAW